MLECEALQLSIAGRAVLQGITLRVDPGRVLAIVGPSGSGKSSLLRVLAGLAIPDRGQVRWQHRTLSDGGRLLVPPGQRDCALHFQDCALFPHLTVRRNLTLALDAMPAPERQRRVAAIAERLGIDDLLTRPAAALSGGEQQRVSLARCLASSAGLLLLDEPWSQLPRRERPQLAALLRAAVQQRGGVAVVVTHDDEEASLVADRLLVLREGRAIAEGSVHELYLRPPCAWVARFLGEANLLSGSALVQAFPEVPPPEDGAGHWLVRPEQIAVTPDAQGPARLAAVTGGGAHTRLALRLPDGTELLAIVNGPQEWTPGMAVRLALRWPAVRMPA